MRPAPLLLVTIQFGQGEIQTRLPKSCIWWPGEYSTSIAEIKNGQSSFCWRHRLCCFKCLGWQKRFPNTYEGEEDATLVLYMPRWASLSVKELRRYWTISATQRKGCQRGYLSCRWLISDKVGISKQQEGHKIREENVLVPEKCRDEISPTKIKVDHEILLFNADMDLEFSLPLAFRVWGSPDLRNMRGLFDLSPAVIEEEAYAAEI